METRYVVLIEPVRYLEKYKAEINQRGECLTVEGVYSNNDGESNEDDTPKYKFA